MTVLSTYTKQTIEKKRYRIDYSRWLNLPTELIQSYEAPIVTVLNSSTVLPDSLLVTIDFTVLDNKALEYVVANGEDGIHYRVSIVMTTTEDQIVEASVDFRIRNYE